MSETVTRILYGRGLNIAAQLSPSRKAFTSFAEIESMKRSPIKQIGCGYLQSYYLMEDGRFIKAGYFMDSLTSIRVLNLHRLIPPLIPLIQSFPLLGNTLSFRGGDEVPTVFNNDIDPFIEVVFGVSRVFGLTKGQVYAMGQNYFGQLGTRNILNYEHTFTKIPTVNNQPITAIGCGFQHTLISTSKDSLYGCGKASDYQIQPLKYAQDNDLAQKIEVPELILKGQKIRKATGGLKFSLIWTEKNKLYAMGDNRFGQCGQNSITTPQVKQLTEIFWQWQKDETILDIACGFCHSLVLTNKHIYFFGSIEQKQNPFNSFNQHICAPTALPIENPRKIFANFDRSAVINKDGQAWIFGGRDFSYCGGESGELERLEGFSERSQIGLGFAHTLLYP